MIDDFYLPNQDGLLDDRPRYGDGSGFVDKAGRPLASALGFRGIAPDPVKVHDLVRAEINRREATRIADAIESRSADPRPFAERMILTLDELAALPIPEPLIEGWLDLGADAQLTGQSGSYKSFVALDMACCVAMGRDWHGRPVKQADVLYVLGEGGAMFSRRIDAWCEHNGVDRSELGRHLTVTRDAIQIGGADWADLTAWLGTHKVRLLVLDTKSRCSDLFGENDNDDEARLHKALRSLCLGTAGGLSTLLVHHTGHANGEAAERARGASSGRGALDHEYILTRNGDNAATLRNDKQKDHKDGEEIGVRMVNVADSLAVDITEVLPLSPRSRWIFDQVAAGVTFDSANALLAACRTAGHKVNNNDKAAVFAEYHVVHRAHLGATYDPNMINRDPFGDDL